LEVLEERLTPSTYTVTDANDTAGSANDVTLRYAINQAVSKKDQNAVINFSNALAGQAITLSLTDSNNGYGPTAFVVNNARITIDGSKAPGLVISGNNALRPFAVTGNASLTLKNLTVQGGLAQGGAGGNGNAPGFGYSWGGGGGGGAGLGGAVYDDGGGFTAEGVTFTNNKAQGGQGATSFTSGFSVRGAGGGGLDVPGQNSVNGGAGGGSGGRGGWYADGGAGGFGGDRDRIGGGGGYGGFGGGDGTYYGSGGGGGGMGGAIFANSGKVTLINDTFTANTAQGGAGYYNGTGYGGAVFDRNGTLLALFDTFSSNTATGLKRGTDVYVLSDGSGTQASATLVDDILGQTSSDLWDFYAGYNNGGTAPNLSGSNNDLVRNQPGTGGGLPASAVISNADPLLSPLANNGGPTQTMAIASIYPAYQAGIPINGITTDQRGVVRSATIPSLGAYEPPKPRTTPTNSGPPASSGPAPTSPGLVGLTIDEFKLAVDSILAAVESTLQMPHASLDAAIAQLQATIANDPMHTLEGQFFRLLGEMAALNALRES
jgi:hypothetical protein